MDSKKATEKYRAAQWMRVIQERKASGKTVKDYCQERDLSRNAYLYW